MPRVAPVTTATVRLEDWTPAVTALGEPCDPSANEHYLWHGAPLHSVESILKHGFNVDLAGVHRGAMLGSGLYFAECSSKADEYRRREYLQAQ